MNSFYSRNFASEKGVLFLFPDILFFPIPFSDNKQTNKRHIRGLRAGAPLTLGESRITRAAAKPKICWGVGQGAHSLSSGPMHVNVVGACLLIGTKVRRHVEVPGSVVGGAVDEGGGPRHL